MRKGRKLLLTPDQYLQFEEAAAMRHEYVDGEAFAMTGETAAHNLICGRLYRNIAGHLDGSHCHAFMNGLKVHIATANCYYYPDLVVTCKPVKPEDVFVEAPTLIIEVLSRSTQHIDRREKAINYRRLESLSEYVLVSQSHALIEHYIKDSKGAWTKAKLIHSDDIVIECLPNGKLCIALAEIYADLGLPFEVHEDEEEYEFA